MIIEADSCWTGTDSLKKEKLLKEMIIKIELKQEDNKGDITVEALLDSGAIGLVMSSEFVRKN